MADMVATLQQQRRQIAELTTTNKVQQTDVESLKNRLQRSVAENDDLLEKLAAMKRDRWRRERQFEEQMKEIADKLPRLENNQQPNGDRSRESEEQTEEGRRNVDRIQRELDAERRRYAELERKQEELQSRLERVQLEQIQSLHASKTADVQIQVSDTQREQRLEDQVQSLTTELASARQRLLHQAGSSRQVERLVHEKAKIKEKNNELSSSMKHLKRKHAISEEQEEVLRTQLDRLKRTLDACNATDEDLEKQLQLIVDKNHELEQLLEQMRTEHSGAKRTEQELRNELENMKQAEDERTARETDLKRQLAKAHEDYNVLSRKTLSEIDRLEQESKRMNVEMNELKKVNIQMANNERQLKAELKEVKLKANENVRRIRQQEIYALRVDLQTREEAYIKLRKENDELLEKMVPKERLEEVETELKQVRKAAEETEMRIQKLQDDQYSLQGKAEQREQEFNEELEKLHSELTTREKQLQEAAEKYLELETKNEKLKQSYGTKEKLFQTRQEQLEKTSKEQHDAFQEKIKTQEEQHLAEKEHMLAKWKEKEKELKNKIKMHEKAKIEEKNNELSSSMEHLKRKHATSEEQEEVLRTQLDRLKRTLDACNVTDEDLEKQLQRIVDKNHELEQLLEQMRTDHSGAKRTEEELRNELEKMKQAEDERTARETDLKCQLTKAHEDYNILSRKTLSEIDRLEEESKIMNVEMNELKKVNLQMANNERQLKTELQEVKLEANKNVRRIREQEIYALPVDLQTTEEACVKLGKDSDKLLEKMVPKERLEEVETELKQVKKAAEETEIRIQKLQNEQYAERKEAEQKEQELNKELEKLRSELTTKEKQLQEAAEKSLELESKNEKLKQSYGTKEKLFKTRQEQLERTAKEQHDAFQKKIKSQEAQHLAEKEHMLTMWTEKEKELKNKLKASKLEIRTEVDKVKSKCEQLEAAHEEKTRQKDEETKRRMNEMKDEIEEQKKLAQKAKEGNKELQEIIDKHVSQTNEFETLRLANDELKEKVGKLERAVLRLRLENDELRENKLHRSRDGNIRELYGEQTVHISDLQLQLDMLRRALKDPSKLSSRLSMPPPDAIRSPEVDRYGGLLAELLNLLKTSAEASKRPAEDSSTLTRELEAERRKVRAGSERIAQLEGWLDTIFNDQQFGIGPSTEQTSQITLPPVDGISTVPAAGSSEKTHKTSDRSPNKQKQTRTSRPKRK